MGTRRRLTHACLECECSCATSSDLIYESMESDLIMSYWFHNARRKRRGDPTLLSPHLRMGPVMMGSADPATRPKPQSKRSLMDSMLTPLDPFEARLWVVFFGMLLASSVLFTWLEPDDDELVGHGRNVIGLVGRVGVVCWWNLIQMTGAGSLTPATRAGRVMYLGWSLALYAIMVWYGANLVAFLAVSNLPDTGIRNINQLIAGIDPFLCHLFECNAPK